MSAGVGADPVKRRHQDLKTSLQHVSKQQSDDFGHDTLRAWAHPNVPSHPSTNYGYPRMVRYLPTYHSKLGTSLHTKARGISQVPRMFSCHKDSETMPLGPGYSC